MSTSRCGVAATPPPAGGQPGANTFQILVTHVAKFHGLIKIFGQNDFSTGEVVSKYLSVHRSELENGLQPTQISPGQSVIVRQDGNWYRGKVNTQSGIKVLVSLVDTGESQVFHLSNIRTDIHTKLQSIPPLAEEYVLGEVVPPAADWSKPSIEFVKDALKGDVCTAQIIHNSHGYDFIRVFKSESREPLAYDMIQCGFAIAGYPSMDSVPPADNYSPPQIAVMPMVQQHGHGGGLETPNYPPPLSGSSPRESPHHYDYQTSWSDGVNGAGDNSRYGGSGHHSNQPGRQSGDRYTDRHHQQAYSTGVQPLTLETGAWYPVTISSLEQAPQYFFVQLQSLNEKLDEIMRSINSMKLNQLPRGQIEAGVPCLARYSVDNSIYRAIIINRADLVQVQYLDYGNSESLPLDQIYELPEPFLSAQMLAVPCRLYQWPENSSGVQADLARNKFDTLTSKTLNCRVMSLESGGLFGNTNIVQLYEDSVDLGQELRMWVSRQPGVQLGGPPGPGSTQLGGPPVTGSTQNGAHQQAASKFGPNRNRMNHGTPVSTPMVSLQTSRTTISYTQVELLGTVDVYLSYHGKGPGLFYVQRADTTNQIQQIMREIANLVKTSPMPLSEPPRAGAPCLAQYSDGVWYRARVETPGPGISAGSHNLRPGQIIVEFVDFGNSDAVWMNQVYGMPASLVTCLPAQAVPCRLAGNFANLQTESLVKPFLDLVQDNLFRIKVEKVLNNLCVVQASTTVQPILNINSELGRMVSQLALSPTMGDSPTVLLVTHFENTNCFYGQRGTNGAEFAIFLANLAEYYSRSGICLYGNSNESHIGEVCGIVETSNTNFKYYRCKVLGEQKTTSDIRILDVGGVKRVDKSCLMTLPEQFQSPPEFGFQCSLGFTNPLTDKNIRMNFQDCFVEVQKVREKGDIVIVKITHNPSSSVKNNHLLRAIKEASPPGGGQVANMHQKPPMFQPYSIHKNPRLGGNNPELGGHNLRLGGQQMSQLPPRIINNTPETNNRYASRENATNNNPHSGDLSLRGSAAQGVASSGGHKRGVVEAGGVYTRSSTAKDSSAGGRHDTSHRRGDHHHGDHHHQGGGSRHEYGPRGSVARYEQGGRNGSVKPREPKRFERGDLRNSLRERRAAREVILSKPVTHSFSYTKLHAGAKFEGKISWMFDPSNFYVQLEKNAEEFSMLMEDMQGEFRSGPFDPKQWKKGTPVAAKYSLDDCWYRGKVVSQRDKFVDIYFVDFGNTDKVDDINVLALPQDFGKLPVQAINCCLAGVDEFSDTWEKVKSSYSKYFNDSLYSVEVFKPGRICQVSLNNGSLAVSLVKDINNTINSTIHRNIGEERLKKNRKKDKEAEPGIDSERGGSHEKEKSGNTKVMSRSTGFPEINPKDLLGKTKNVFVSNHFNWREFWVQLDTAKLDEVDNLLNNNESVKLYGDPIKSFNPGEKCLVKLDGHWCRAQVLEHDSTTVSVFCVDTGITTSVQFQDIWSGSTQIFDKHPPLAVKCKLDLKMLNFERILEKSNNLLRVKFKSYRKNAFVVKLEKEKGMEKEKKEGSVPVSEGEQVGVSVTYLETVEKIWFVPGDRLDRLNQLMEQLSNTKETLKAAGKVELDQIYAVKYHEDGEMYRAMAIDREQSNDIDEVTGESIVQVQVHFIDYGNHEVVEEHEVFKLSEKFQQDDAFAEMIELKGAEYALDSTETKEKFETYLSNSHVIVKKMHKVSGRNEGALIVDGKPLNLNQWLRFKEGTGSTGAFNLFRHCGSVRIDCFVSNVSETKNTAWILEKHMLQDLERMMSDLQDKVEEGHKPRKIEKGRMVCAKYSKDGEYYRAKINSIKDKKADIYYLDFGNSETVAVSDLIELPKQFILHPGFSMKVALDNKDDCRLLSPDEMASIISDGIQLTAELVQPKHNIIRLYLGGERIGYEPNPQRAKDGSFERSLLPPARIRTEGEEIGLFVGLGERKSFVLQNVMSTKKLLSRLSSCDLEPAVISQQAEKSCDQTPAKLETIDKNHMYIYEDAETGRQRVQILEKQKDDNSTRIMVKMQFSDNFQVKVVDLKELEGSLFICPVSLKKIGPASIRVSAADFREQFKLFGQLFHQSYVSNKRLSIKEYKIDVKVAEIKNVKSPNINGTFPNIILNIAKLSVLYNLSAEQLCGLRNNIVDHCLQNNKLELNLVQEDTTTTQQESEESINDKDNIETRNITTNLKTFQPIVDSEAMTVNIHESLPSIDIKQQIKFKIIENSTSQTEQKIVSIVNEDDKNVGDVLKSIATDSLDAFEKNVIDSKSLAVYCEEDRAETVVQLYRCLVLSTVNSTARIYLVDSVKTRYCDISELRPMPASLLEFAPTALPVNKIHNLFSTASHQNNTDSVLAGKIIVADGSHLELHVTH